MALLTTMGVEAELSPDTKWAVLPLLPSNGVWSVAVTVTERAATALVCVPSLIWKLTVRVALLGTTRSLVKRMDRRAVCHCASEAPPAEVSVRTPVPLS